MLRLVLIVAAVVLLVLLLRGGLRRGGGTSPSGDASRRGDRRGEPQPMVACAHCGVHLPRGDAVITRQGTFCGEPHRLAYEREHGGG